MIDNLSLQVHSSETIDCGLSQHICTTSNHFFYTNRISRTRGIKWYSKVHLFQYKYIEIEAPPLAYGSEMIQHGPTVL